MIAAMLATSYNDKKQVSTTKCVEVFEDFLPVTKIPSEKLKIFVARTLRGMRQDYMDTHNMTTDEQFAEHAGMDKKSIYNWENMLHSPSLDNLNDFAQACDSTLAEFFSRLVARSDLVAIKRANEQEEEWIDDLVSGLSYPKLREVVQKTAEWIRYVRELLEGRSSKP